MINRIAQTVSPASGVSWCVDRQVTWVLAGERMLRLTGEDQAVWGWMTLSLSVEVMAALLDKIGPGQWVSARERVERMVKQWLEQGILTAGKS